MRGGGRLLAVVVLATSVLVAQGAVSGPAGATPAGESFVTQVSQRYSPTGPAVDSGASSVWRSSDSDITLTGSVSQGVTVTVDDGTDSPAAQLGFAAPVGDSLAPGTYLDAQRLPDRTGRHPGVQTIDDGYCEWETGRFTVLDVAPDLSRLDLIYEIHCTTDQHTLFGEVRVGEPDDGSGLTPLPGHVAWPPTYPGTDGRKVPVTFVNTGAAAVTITGAAVTGSDASSFSVTDSTCSSVAVGATCTIWVRYHPTVADAVTARLEVHDSTPVGRHVVELAGRGVSGHTSWRMDSDPGDYIGAGYSYDFDPLNAQIYAHGNEQHVELNVQQGGRPRFWADFVGDQAHPLLPGSSFTASEYPFNGDDPGMSVHGDGRGDAVRGTFTVQQATYDPDGTVTSFAVTFEQHVRDAAPALFGSIAWQTAAPAAPLPRRHIGGPVDRLTGSPLQGSALLTWLNPASDYFDHTVVRRARGLRAPASPASGTAQYAGRGLGVLSTDLLAETSYSWTVFTYYGSGEQAAPVHLTLRGSRIVGRLSAARPRRGHATHYSARLLDVATGHPVAGQPVQVYVRSGRHGWRWQETDRTDAQGVVRRAWWSVRTRTSFKAVFAGGGNHLGSTSDVATALPR